MIDLSKEPFVFRTQTAAETRDQLVQQLPKHTEVTVTNGAPPQIKIRDGLWRGATLHLDTASQQVRLTRIIYRIPGFLPMVIIFVASAGVLSLIMSAIIGARGGLVGGAGGFGMYSIVKAVVFANMKSTWSPELQQAIEKLKP